jgi:hypothetical protein
MAQIFPFHCFFPWTTARKDPFAHWLRVPSLPHPSLVDFGVAGNRERVTSPTPQLAMARAICVLVVDDFLDGRELVVEYLTFLGSTFDVACDARTLSKLQVHGRIELRPAASSRCPSA